MNQPKLKENEIKKSFAVAGPMSLQNKKGKPDVVVQRA
jgi:hypothetical protein